MGKMVVMNKSAIRQLDRAYQPVKAETKEETKVLGVTITYAMKSRAVSSFFAFAFLILTIVQWSITEATTYQKRKFPTSIHTYFLRPWTYNNPKEMLMGITAPNTVQSNLLTLWAWGDCSKYITTHQIPKPNSKNELVNIDETNPIYLPGGCNCLAQVAHSMGTDWTMASTSPSLETVTDRLKFCTQAAQMPVTMVPRQKPHRLAFYLYSFIVLAASAILISNANHIKWDSTKHIKYLKNMNSNTDDHDSGETKRVVYRYHWVLLGIVVFTLVVLLTFLMITLLECKSCAPDIKPGYRMSDTISVSLLVLALVFLLPFVGSFTVINKDKWLSNMASYFGEDPAVYDKYSSNMEKAKLSLNIFAGLEQFFYNIILIPALCLFAVGLALLRAWQDENVLWYIVVLAFYLGVIYTSNDYVSAKWVIDNMTKQEKDNNKEFQTFKIMALFAVLFIIMSLSFTALPPISPTYYHEIGFNDWVIFIVAVFSIILLPDLCNEIFSINLHHVNVFRQYVTLFVLLAVIFTTAYSVLLNYDMFT